MLSIKTKSQTKVKGINYKSCRFRNFIFVVNNCSFFLKVITRRHIRIRVVQSVYSFLINSPPDEHRAKQLLKSSLHQVRDLLLLELALFQKIHELAKEKIQIIRQSMTGNQEKYRKYDGLANNPCFENLIHSTDLNNIASDIKDYWNQHEYFIDSLIDDLFESQEYHRYMEILNPNKNQHRKVLIYFFKDIIAPSKSLQEIYQEYSISFTDDLPLVNTYVLKIISKIDLEQTQKTIIPDQNRHDKEIQFGISLLDQVLSNINSIKKQYQSFIKNWTLDRLVTIDSAILNVAIAEMRYFEDIPPKVTINEYLEIAKDYSTEKSAKFINGILDQLLNKNQIKI